jgi:hypothetical protein
MKIQELMTNPTNMRRVLDLWVALTFVKLMLFHA